MADRRRRRSNSPEDRGDPKRRKVEPPQPSTKPPQPTPRLAPNIKQEPPAPPNRGLPFKGSPKGCQQVVLRTNKFDVKLPHITYSKYHITCQPETRSRALKNFLVAEDASKTFGVFAVWGESLYSVKRPADQFLWKVKSRSNIEYEVELKWTKDFDKEDWQEMRVLYGIMFRRYQSHPLLKLKKIGVRGLYEKDPVCTGRIMGYRGYSSAINVCLKGVRLSCDVVFKLLRKETVLERMKELSHDRWYELEGQVVYTDYGRQQNKTHRITRVSDVMPKHTFPRTTKGQTKEISYVQYYKECYNIEIKSLDMPLLAVEVRQRSDDKTKLIYLVPELCKMTGLKDEARPKQTELDPNERAQYLLKHMSDVASCLSKPIQSEKDPAVYFHNDWKFELIPEMSKVDAFIAPPEKIIIRNPQQAISGVDVDPMKGWAQNFYVKRDQNTFCKAAEFRDWVVVHEDRNEEVRTAKEFFRTFKENAGPLGVNIAEPKFLQVGRGRAPRGDDYVNAIKEVMKIKKPNFVVCIFTRNDKQKWKAVKEFLCENGIISQCVTSAKAANRPAVSKMILQMNAKAGGINWGSAWPKGVVATFQKCLIIGVDQSVNKSARKTVFAMCSSVPSIKNDETELMTRYYHHCRLVESSQISLFPMIQKALTEFKNTSNAYPENIVLYRTGLNPSQTTVFRESEIPSLVKYLETLKSPEGVIPKLAVVLVSKSLTTRLFEFTQGQGRFFNPKPGTICDDESVTIYDPLGYEFFIVSHSPKTKGSVAPTSYRVIYNDTIMDPNKMQRVTYKLCHLYYNTADPVSVPACLQYAKKLAFLAAQAGKNINESLNKFPHQL